METAMLLSGAEHSVPLECLLERFESSEPFANGTHPQYIYRLQGGAEPNDTFGYLDQLKDMDMVDNIRKMAPTSCTCSASSSNKWSHNPKNSHRV